MIEYGLSLRRALAAAMRRHRPELVVTVNHRETYPGGGFNMADHRVTGLAVLDAVRDAANRWVFTDLADEGLPNRGAGCAGWRCPASPQSSHAVDITDTFDRGVASLAAHRRYLAALGDGPMADPETFLRTMAERTAEQFGGRLSTSFELIAM